jgi:hypothetical protein
MSAFLPSYEGQSVTNRHQLQTGSRSVSQPVTNCHQLTELFQRDKSVITRHIKSVSEEGELVRGAALANSATTAVTDGGNCCKICNSSIRGPQAGHP